MTSLAVRIAQTEFSDRDIESLLALDNPADIEQLRGAAYDTATREVGDEVYYRGLIELSNICSRNCLYCGIRSGNKVVERYSLDLPTVVETAIWAAHAGYGSCVLQAGERQDEKFISFIEECIRVIKRQTISETLPQGLGITLSLGEQTADTYHRWRAAGAHRYLLRIETSSPELFARIHPADQSLTSRLQALNDLAETGFQVGTGVMIGLPGQTIADLAADIRFFTDHDIDMIGMGPYITAAGNSMQDAEMMEQGRLVQLAMNMIAVTRLVLRDVNIAATTALETLVDDGRERGISFGANVIMPNLTPLAVRTKYQLYDGKPGLDECGEDTATRLERGITSVGRRIGRNAWGDSRHFARRVVPICKAY